MTPKKKLKLGMFVRPCGHHIASWRHPGSQVDANINFEHFVDMARNAERGLFDMLFSADSPTAYTAEIESLHRSHYTSWIEPYSLLTALAPLTTHIGLVCTASTSFDFPYSVARRFSSLDLISHGRSGWNIVTTGNPIAAENYGGEPHLPKPERYRRAREFADIVFGLWDSWEEDVFVRDRASGIYFDRTKMHELGHKGNHYAVRGPLNVARSPQGRPVIVQAGASDEGRDFAAEAAEVVFTAHETMEGAKAFYADVKSRMGTYGRSPDDMKIMPGILVTVAPTREEAHLKFQSLQDLIHPEIGVGLLSRRVEFDLSSYPVDGPVPHVDEDHLRNSRSAMMFAAARREGLTIRQLYQRFAASRGHLSVVGTPEDVADLMETWLAEGAADGFNVMPPTFPEGLNDFVNLVIPELQRRGLFRTSYEGSTLRENLGLKAPLNRYSKLIKAGA